MALNLEIHYTCVKPKRSLIIPAFPKKRLLHRETALLSTHARAFSIRPGLRKCTPNNGLCFKNSI